MKKHLLALTLFLVTSISQAYDLDTHFYGTYSMARFAGIRHEVALKIATGAQWMDESYISDPLSMILLPDVGIKKRRLLHFPGSRLANKLTTDKLPDFLLHDPSSGLKLKIFTETEADHSFASEMFTEGLIEGDLMKAAAGLHTLEDSFAHAGTIAELGHAHFWHHPDRPYVDEMSVDKYFKMCRSVLKAMVAIRSLLPMSAVDVSTKFTEIPNYQLDGNQLADIYTNLPVVKQVVSHKILNDPTFVKFALENVFSRATKVNYLKNGYNPDLNNFTPGQDAYQAAQSISEKIPSEMINISAIMKDSGGPLNLDDDYIESMGGIVQFALNVIHDLLSNIIPRPMDAYHRFEKEENGPVWIKELDMRVANMRGLIQNLYGKNIYFVANNTGTQKGYLKELVQSPEAKPLPFPKDASTEYVTYSLEEKAKFNQMIFSFLFPQVTHYLKDNLNVLNNLIASTQETLSKPVSEQGYLGKTVELYGDTKEAAALILKGINITTVYSLARTDVNSSRLRPNPKNKYYTIPRLLKKEIDAKTFKPLLNSEKLNLLIKK